MRGVGCSAWDADRCFAFIYFSEALWRFNKNDQAMPRRMATHTQSDEERGHAETRDMMFYLQLDCHGIQLVGTMSVSFTTK